MKKLLFISCLFFVFGQIVNGRDNLRVIPGSIVVSPASQYEVPNIDISKNTRNIGNVTANKTNSNTSKTQISNYGIVAYEFWFDNNYASKVFQNITPQQTYLLNTVIHTDGLRVGLHIFHIRFKDNSNGWSSVNSKFFYKTKITSGLQNSITAYQYWFDNNDASKVSQNITPQQTYSLNTTIKADGLTDGLHAFHIRFKDNSNRWSSVSSKFFYKTKPYSGSANLITAYRYWFDMSGSNMVTVNLPTPVSPYLLTADIGTQGLNKGFHTVHFQFKDSSQQWSSALTSLFSLDKSSYGAAINILKNGPSENVYSIPGNGTGYVYFSMVNAGGHPVIDTNSFNISLSDQANRKYQATGLFIKPGVLRIAIPGGQITSPNGISNTITIQNSLQIGDTLYRLSSAPPAFNIAKVQPVFTRTFDFFADGSAGISESVGSVGIGASIAMATISITGTAGIGLNISVDPDNNLTLSRRFEAGIESELEIPSINIVVGKVSTGIGAGITSKTILSQEISLKGLQNLTPDQVTMTQAGFVLETLSMGIGNFSPTLGIFLKAIKQSLFKTSGISQTLKDALIKTSWGTENEGTLSAGFSADWGPIKLDLAKGSMTGVLSGETSYYPKGLPEIGNATGSNSITIAANFNFSSLNFSFEN